MNPSTELQQLAEEFRESLRQALYIARHMDADTDLSATQVSILKMAAGDGMRVSEIARNLGVRVPSATEQIIRLEKAGLLLRSPDPRDSRGVRVTLAEDGPGRLAAANTARTALMTRLLEQLSEGEQQALAAALPVISKLNTLPRS